MAEAQLPGMESRTKTIEELDAMMRAPRTGLISRTLVSTEAYNTALIWMEDPTLPPKKLSCAIKLADFGLNAMASHLPENERINLRVGLGLIVAEILAARMQGVARLDSTWELCVVRMLLCFSQWKIDFSTDVFNKQSHTLKKWIIRMIQNTGFCFKVSLRLQVLSLVCLWGRPDIHDPSVMGEVWKGFMSICAMNRLEALLPSRSLPGKLMSHFVRVLMDMQRWGHMNAMCAAAAQQAEQNRIGPETVCLLRISEMTGEAAVEARRMERVSRQGSLNVLYVMGNVMAIFSVLLLSGPVITAFDSNCLAESAAASLVKATSAALACMPSTVSLDHQNYVYILTATDVMMYSVNTRDELRSLKHVMHISHFYTLADLYDYSKMIGYPFRRKLAKFNEKCNETSPDR